eukprot:SAG31_NODE_687_length_12813_cov_2.597216_13_plen_248_part_00
MLAETLNFLPRQVGGRWKVLHYVLRQTAFADILAACSVDGVCYIKNDSPGKPWVGNVTISTMQLASGDVDLISTQYFSLQAGAGVLQAFCASGDGDGNKRSCQSLRDLLPQCYNASSSMATCVLVVDVVSSGEIVTHNVVALAPPKMMVVPRNVSVSATVTTIPHEDNASSGGVEVSLLARGGTALYVVATTTLAGRFSDNAITLAPNISATIQFLPFGELAEKPTAEVAAKLTSNLRVEHMGQYCC